MKIPTALALSVALTFAFTACGSTDDSSVGGTTPDTAVTTTAPDSSAPDTSAPATSAPATSAPNASGDIAASVAIIDFEFADGNVTVNVGDTIEWTNTGDAPHTVTSDDADFDSGSLSKGDTFTFKATEAGDFTYFCQFHSSMQGTITVIG